MPYEILNKKFRIAQKTLDRELSQIQTAANELERGLADGNVADITRLLGGVVERLQVLKRKADESIVDELSAGFECKRRLDHLRQSCGTMAISPTLSLSAGNAGSSICSDDTSNASNIGYGTTITVGGGGGSDFPMSASIVSTASSLIDAHTMTVDCDVSMQGDSGAAVATSPLAPAMTTVTTSQWKKIRLDRMIVEHLLRLGFYETAERLADRVHIRDLTNVDIFKVSRDVELDLRARQTAKCSAWCADNKSKLRKISSTIEFQLRVQEFVELIRADRRLDAVMHARRTFGPFEADQMTEIRQCMGLLAFPCTTEIEPYRSLYDAARWDDLVMKFRMENYRLFQLSTQSVLGVAVQAGLSALKTPQCYSHGSKNMNCPVCQAHFNEIAEHLPFSHCAQSRLICRLTGEPLNEHNLPMMLPNGQVFGQLVSGKARCFFFAFDDCL